MVSLPVGARLGRYQMLERIGRGGMASVYKAYSPEQDREVAVKVLPSHRADDPAFVERFRQEAQAVASLDHPNIIRFYDFGEDKGFTYIVTEYLAGGTLQDRLGRKLSLEEVLELIAPLAEALDHSHSNGIVHRDVKPTNILLDTDGRPVLTDFGLVRMVEGSLALTRSESVLGTPEYMSPEQALGERAGPKSDQYSLGVIVYQMLLGRTPFRGETPIATVLAHVTQPVPRPSTLDADVDPRLESILLKVLSKKPEGRLGSTVDLADALTSVLTKSGNGTGFGSQETVESPVVHSIDSNGSGEADTLNAFDPLGQVLQGTVSLAEAEALAVRHARENTDFYGKPYSHRQLAWDVVSSEDAGDLYEIRLSFRPARWFWGDPRMEQVTVHKAGAITLRRVIEEPAERVGPTGLLAGVLILSGVAAFGLIVYNLVPPRPSATPVEQAKIATPFDVASVWLLPYEAARLVSPRGDVTVDVDVGSVDKPWLLSYRSLAPYQTPPLPTGVVPSDKSFSLWVSDEQEQTAASFSFIKPVIITVRLTAEDAALAGGNKFNIVLQHYSDADGQWTPLPSSVNFRSSIAQAQTYSLSKFALSIRSTEPASSLSGQAAPSTSTQASITPVPTPISNGGRVVANEVGTDGNASATLLPPVASPTPSPKPTAVPTAIPTAAPMPTPTAVPSPTPRVVASQTPALTATLAPKRTPAPSPVPAPTQTPLPISPGRTESSDEDTDTAAAVPPNLVTFRPERWDAPLVVSDDPASFLEFPPPTEGSLLAGTAVYLHWAIKNESTVPITEPFQIAVSLDGAIVQTFPMSGIGAQQVETALNVPLVVTTPGAHVLALIVDFDSRISETEELDNIYRVIHLWQGSVASPSSPESSYPISVPPPAPAPPTPTPTAPPGIPTPTPTATPVPPTPTPTTPPGARRLRQRCRLGHRLRRLRLHLCLRRLPHPLVGQQHRT